MQRIDWITGTTITNDSTISTMDMSWWNQTIDGVYSAFYAFEEDYMDEVKNLTTQIYNFSGLNLQPNQVIVLTDALCGSTCACFTKHLLQMQNVYAIGFGGAYNSSN